MSGALRRSLRAVRMLRERRETVEEQALAAASHKARQARAEADRCSEERAALRDSAAQRTGMVWTGIEHQQRDADLLTLTRRETEALEQWHALEQLRVEQMRVYRAAHADCEVIAALQVQRRAADLAVLSSRERKAEEALFLGRRSLMQREAGPEAEVR